MYSGNIHYMIKVPVIIFDIKVLCPTQTHTLRGYLVFVDITFYSPSNADPI